MYTAAYACFKSDPTDKADLPPQSDMEDIQKMFGPHAKLRLQNRPPVLAHEELLMQQLRLRLGPYAAQEALLYHLRAARGKLNWAVNTYFRAVLASDASCTDFQPRHYAQLNSTGSRACSSSKLSQNRGQETSHGLLGQMPNVILEQILQGTDLATVCNAMATCKAFKAASSSEPLWRHLYHRRWHCNPHSDDMLQVLPPQQPLLVHHTHQEACVKDHEHADEDGDGSSPDTLTAAAVWQQLYHKRHSAECQMQCPVCRQSKIVPVVYGFPSHLLTVAMRAGMLRMGNDHLIEGQPVWTCISCCVELNEFPFPVYDD